MKREVYVMPLFPAVAVLAGEYLVEAAGRRLPGARLAWIAAALVCAAGVVLSWRMAPSLAALVGSGAAPRLEAATALLLAATLIAAFSRLRAAPFFVAAACGAAFLAVLDIETRTARYDPFPAFGQRVRSLCPAGCEGYRISIQCTSMEYYSRREWVDLIEPRQLLARVPPEGGFVIVPSRWERLIERLGFRIEVLERRPWLEQNWAAASLSRGGDPFVSLSLLRIEKAVAAAPPAGAAGSP
jgi:hypothetical protein